jgi:DNA repair protein RecN (Recombination protein N)
MLTDLSIKNFAIIENLQVTFDNGLNILSGETGAGKSIIIGAIQLILGGRVSPDIIRTGADEAVIEALFDLTGQNGIIASLGNFGVDCDGELLVKRVVTRSGKNRVYLNGGLSTIAMLSETTRLLVNIYGQHESQTLLRPENHLALLDGFGGNGVIQSEVAALFEEYSRTRAEIRRLEEGERESARRADLLLFQSAEIGGADLKTGEDESLAREKQLLSHGEKLFQNSQWAFETLYGGDQAILGLLNQVHARITANASIDDSLVPLAENLQAISIQLEDIGLSLRDYAGKVEADPERLQEVHDRIDLIQTLKRKYAPTVEEIILFKEQVDRELEMLTNSEQIRKDLDVALAAVGKQLVSKAEELSAKRYADARGMKLAMEKELHELAMNNARFEVSLEKLAEPRATGLEKAEFLISSNPGETPKPLSRIASGGELSRIMLALKQVHPESDVPTLIFDEVDSGIGGAVSALVGKKLKKVSRRQQVLCITHLPQVAAFADQHFKVEKKVAEGRTTTRVASLSGEQRVTEMARMLGGIKIGEKTLEHAREMLDEAAQDVNLS